jgi:DNA-binding response OmpR family regulator
LKVLIIDDETDICYLLSTLLRKINLDAVFVHTIAEARLKLQEVNPGVIFLDNHLPDGMGVDFISHIKNMLPETKIAMITAHDTAMDREKALKEGADFFIGKPFSRGTIHGILESLKIPVNSQIL